MTKHLVVQFASFGPYHFTRLRSAREALEPLGWKVSGLQTAGVDATYPWDEDGPDSGALATAIPNGTFGGIPAAQMRRGMMDALDRLRPDAVAIAGWGTPDARAALEWCRGNKAKAIVMSETRASDGTRQWWKEWLKARLIRRFDGALVGGKAHRDYLVQLGMPEERIRIGYDIVDNEYFATKVAEVRKGWRVAGEGPEGGSVFRSVGSSVGQGGEAVRPEPYFLASSRFIERKNLRRLIDAYAGYRRSFQCSVSSVQSEKELRKPWELVLLGTGDGREELERYVSEKGIDGIIFAGFQQIDALPGWYAGAGAFVHPALEEPWGLVINEAMASGLPVICSRTTGAAELIEEGVNGFLFDPKDMRLLGRLMVQMSGFPPEVRALYGLNSARIINEKAPASAFGSALQSLLQSS